MKKLKNLWPRGTKIKKMKNNKKIIVLYHKSCTDGFGAAWVAWRKLGRHAEYIAVKHDDPYPEIVKGRDTYLLDISYDFKKTKKLIKDVKSLTIIDHHISTEKSTKLAGNYLYALDHSGSALAWQYFHPNKKTPTLVKYIEDIDIWNMAMRNTRELLASLETYDHDFVLWNKIAKDWERGDSQKKYLVEGKAILKYKDYLIEKAVKDGDEVTLLGKRALVVNNNLSLNSEIGDAIRKKGYPLGIIWQQKNDKLVVSVRSTAKVDSSKIAARFGGGGHKKASAFRLPAKIKFPWKRIKK